MPEHDLVDTYVEYLHAGSDLVPIGSVEVWYTSLVTRIQADELDDVGDGMGYDLFEYSPPIPRWHDRRGEDQEQGDENQQDEDHGRPCSSPEKRVPASVTFPSGRRQFI